ncbi:MAG TPA: AI-2E family transporter [Methanoregula sp.]|nr:AI-2E family transporter [Methanoregula sp.]
MIDLAMLFQLIGAQVFLFIFLFCTVALGDFRSAAIVVLSGWIDFYYRPVMMGKRVAVHPVFMMIGIFGGVPFMGPVGFILGPVLVALMVTGFKIYAEHAGVRPPPVSGP